MLHQVLVPESGLLILKDTDTGKENYVLCLGYYSYKITSIVYDLAGKPIAYSGFITVNGNNVAYSRLPKEDEKIIAAKWTTQGVFFYPGTESNVLYNLVIIEPVMKPSLCEKETAVCETISELVEHFKEGYSSKIIETI